MGYVPDSSGDCIDPTLDYCNTATNLYACYLSSGLCISKGWTKNSSDSSCDAPSASTCTTTSGMCNLNSDACSFIYGYI